MPNLVALGQTEWSYAIITKLVLLSLIIIIIIEFPVSIAPYTVVTRGAGGRSDQCSVKA